MSDDGFNFHGIEITGGQNVLGKNEGGMHQHNAEGTVTMPAFIEKVAESVPEEVAVEIKPLIEMLANMPAEKQQEAIENETPEWLGLVSRIQPHATSVWKNIATFGAAALQTFAERQPLVAGIMAVCEANKA